MQMLSRLNTHNVRLRLDKCQWFVPKIEFLGFVVSSEGRTPAKNLHRDILNAPPPTDVRSLRSFLGMINFYSMFLPNFSTITKPLRSLLEKDSRFSWSKECDEAFTKCKELLSSNTLLIHNDPRLPIVVMADASPVGVGAILAHVVEVDGQQVERPVMFASCALSETQQRYAKIDREVLACIFAVTKFCKYLWGRRFTLVTDNAAIQRIFHPGRNLPVRTDHRLQHWATLLQPYDFDLIHRPSAQLAPADALSRLPSSAKISCVHLIPVNAELPVSSECVAEETAKDPVLREVLEVTRTGWPNYLRDKNCPLKPYFLVRG